jgi:hypothetical protein
MKARTLAALPVGLVLVAALLLAIYHDAQHGVADYHAAVATALPAHR